MAKKAKKTKAEEKKNKQMVRVSDEDHKILTEMATENDRSLAAENHRALLDYFRKNGKLPPATST